MRQKVCIIPANYTVMGVDQRLYFPFTVFSRFLGTSQGIKESGQLEQKKGPAAVSYNNS
jgi:hypothetical protein